MRLPRTIRSAATTPPPRQLRPISFKETAMFASARRKRQERAAARETMHVSTLAAKSGHVMAWVRIDAGSGDPDWFVGSCKRCQRQLHIHGDEHFTMLPRCGQHPDREG